MAEWDVHNTINEAAAKENNKPLQRSLSSVKWSIEKRNVNRSENNFRLSTSLPALVVRRIFHAA